jgi:hypothetical protein
MGEEEKGAERKLPSDEEYIQIQQQLVIFGQLLMNIDVEGFIERAERADAIAPVIDPTLWMRGHERLDALKDLAHGAMKFKMAAAAFQNTMARIAAKESARGGP